MTLFEFIFIGLPAGAFGLWLAANTDCYGKWVGPTPRSIYRAIRRS